MAVPPVGNEYASSILFKIEPWRPNIFLPKVVQCRRNGAVIFYKKFGIEIHRTMDI